VILDQLTHPIVLAPMAGGPSTPALVAAVSEAGGLGFIAGGYRRPEDLRADIDDVRSRTNAPFGVNVFVPGSPHVDEDALAAYIVRLEPEAARLGVQLGEPRFDDDGWAPKLELLHQARVPLASFTFGCPPRETIGSLQLAGTEVWVTATDVAEARAARDAGADAIVLQGIEAGAHRAAWIDTDGLEGLGVLPLLRLVASEIELPLVAAGGLGDGQTIAGVLAAGASAAQLGTAFLRAPEAGTSDAHRQALTTERPTALTRAFTGRLARGLVNRFMVEHGEDAPIAYPHVHHMTAPLRAAARRRDDVDGFNLWAGQAHRLAKAMPAVEIVRGLAAETRQALSDATMGLERRN
jgi:nitronate monooxygenase